MKSIINIIEKHQLKILLLITSLALLIQIFNLDYKSLWRDEIWRIYISEFDLVTILSSPDKSHPPFYNIILHFFLYLGKSEFIVRLPSVILSVLSVPLVYIIGKKFFDYQVGLIGSLLFATSPLALWYAQDANMYSLFVFLSLLSILTFYIAIQTNSLQFWILFILFNLLNLYTYYLAIFIIITQLLFILLFMKRYSVLFVKFLKSLLIVFILFIPQLFSVYQGYFLKLAEHQNTAWGITPTLFPKIIFLDLTIGHAWWQGSSFLDYIVILFIFLFFYGLIASYKDHKETVSFLAIWVFIPILLAFLLSYKIDIATRYILFILPGFLIVISRSLICIKKINIILFFLLLFCILGSNAVYLNKTYNTPNEDWRSTSRFIQNNLIPGDELLIIPSFSISPYIYYGLNESVITGLNTIDGVTTDQEHIESIEKLCSNNSRLWVTYFPHASHVHQTNVIINWLNAYCTLKYETNPKIQVFLCENCDKKENISCSNDIVIYDEIPLNYSWSGLIGSNNGLSLKKGNLDTANMNNPQHGEYCTRITYDPTLEEWIGVWIQATGDWNCGLGIGENVTGANRLTFYARGEDGGEIITFAYGYFKSAGDPYITDSAHGKQTIILTNKWQEYQFDLSEEPPSYINGLFMVYIDKENNPKDVTFYLDSIIYKC